MPYFKFIMSMFTLTLISASNCDATDSTIVVKLGADDWCPFTCNSPVTDHPGIVTETVKEALALKGIQTDYVFVSWARAIKLAEQNNLNGVLGAYLSDLPNFIATKKAIIRSRDCFYTNKDESWKFKDTKSLTSRKIGIIKNYSYGDYIDDLKKKGSEFHFFESTGEDGVDQNIKKLQAKRIDTMLENEMVIGYLKSKGKLPDFKNGGCLDDKDIYAVFNPKNPKNNEYVKIIDDFLEKHPERVKAIVEKYVSTKSK